MFYSIGTNSSDLKTGSPTLTITNGIASLTIAQTGNVGVGDAICWNSACPLTNSKVHIAEVLGPKTFRVQTPTGGVPSGTTQGSIYIKRAFNSISGAVTGSTGTYFFNSATIDLVTRGVKLTWVAYKDATDLTDTVATDITTTTYTNTSAAYYLTLTVASAAQVASGTSQRHTGTATLAPPTRPPSTPSMRGR